MNCVTAIVLNEWQEESTSERSGSSIWTNIECYLKKKNIL